MVLVSDTSCSLGTQTSSTNRRTVSISCCLVSASSAIFRLRKAFVLVAAYQQARQQFPQGAGIPRAVRFCHSGPVRKGDRCGSSNRMSLLESRFGTALEIKGPTSNEKG